MHLNNVHYSNGFQRAQGKGGAQMGAISGSSSALQEIHFPFDSCAASQDVGAFWPLRSFVRGFQPPKAETSEWSPQFRKAHAECLVVFPGMMYFYACLF